MFYSLLALSSRHALRWCYREVQVVGELPAKGPLLLAVNHPNDLADICAVLAYVPRRVNFVANVTATEQPIVAWAYRQMGVVPVHRVRDARKAKARGEDSAQANAMAFTRVREVLQRGGCVCVFPEGGVTAGAHLGALRNGLARMALEARDDSALHNLRIVPVGLTYEARYERRTRVLVEFGDAITISEWQAPEARPEAPQLTARIASHLRAVTRNAPDERAAESMRAVTMVCATTAAQGSEPLRCATHTWREIADETYGPGIDAPVHENARVKLSEDVMRAVEVALPGIGAERALNAWNASKTGRAASAWAAALVNIPFAFLGAVLHVPVWWLIELRAKRAAATRAEFIPRLIIPGLYVMFAWYLAIVFLVATLAWARGLSGWVAVLVGLTALVAAPPLGDAAMRSWDWWRDRQIANRLRTAIPDLDDRLRNAAHMAARDSGNRSIESATSSTRNIAQPI